MKIYLKILQFAQPLWRYVLPFFVFSILGSVFGIVNFTLLQPLLDVLFGNDLPPAAPGTGIAYFVGAFNNYLYNLVQSHGKVRALQFICMAILGSVLLSNIFRYGSVRTIERMKGAIVTNIRTSVFEHISRLDLGFFNNERKGNLMTHLTTDVLEVEGSIGRAFSAIFKESFLLVGFFITLFYKSVELTAFSLIVIPLSGLVIGGISKRLKEHATEVQNVMGRMVSIIDETFGGIRVVKGFAAEGYLNDKFGQQNQQYFRLWRNMIYRQEMASPVSEFLGVAVVTGILLYGGSMVLSGESGMSASAFVSYIILFSQVTRPAKEISNALSGMQRGKASAERIFGILATEPEIKDIPNAKHIENFNESVDFQDITFGYSSERPVLKNINFRLIKGKTVALVGASGSGKSTLADLLPRFYDPDSGQISLDGTDIRNLRQGDLRRLLGIVTQESILFNDSIYQNIAFGLPTTPAEVETAARIANAHEFIVGTPDGYDTLIGDRGSKLSGGQRQRLSIARAILRNPPILILDEATSALDTESEKLVQEALTRLMQNRTTLVIAHRLSTIQHADEILVMNQGEIVERGTHATLLKNPEGVYTKLNKLQFG